MESFRRTRGILFPVPLLRLFGHFPPFPFASVPFDFLQAVDELSKFFFRISLFLHFFSFPPLFRYFLFSGFLTFFTRMTMPPIGASPQGSKTLDLLARLRSVLATPNRPLRAC